ncbi:hypothetical protein EVAR_74763_1 [Eumeta japonica]|uniref:Uncharacterized protein n=1 Tax=Eumeta variegata TaxID=151549 RepID=A0A4C1SPD8_EUMVA|nr:hypothetical protein EVAR_74763_1 [Eumeta japonica]
MQQYFVRVWYFTSGAGTFSSLIIRVGHGMALPVPHTKTVTCATKKEMASRQYTVSVNNKDFQFHAAAARGRPLARPRPWVAPKIDARRLLLAAAPE